jgi:hypothetical protein
MKSTLLSSLPRRRAQILTILAAVAAAPAGALAAPAADDLIVEIEPADGDYEDLDPIGIDGCRSDIRKTVTLTARANDYTPGDLTQKYIYVTRDKTTACDPDILEQACASKGTEVDGCTCLYRSDVDSKSQISLENVALSTLLPDGGLTACSGSAESIYRFFLKVTPSKRSGPAPAPDDGAFKQTSDAADAGTSDAMAADAATGGSTQDSAAPLVLEIDLEPPTTPAAEEFRLLSGDKAIEVSFPSSENAEIVKYEVCWSASGLTDGAATDGGVSGTAGECKQSSGTESVRLTADGDGLRLERAYRFSVAAVDDAENVGDPVGLGTGVPRNYLDVAEYYRQMHGPETGGCVQRPGLRGAGFGLAGLFLAALSALAVGRRRNR